jgi:hypothetical protein
MPDIRQGCFVVLHAGSAGVGDDTYKALLAWAHETQCWLIVINYAECLSQGSIHLAEIPLPAGVLRFRDHVHDGIYEHSCETIQHSGLPVVLPPFGTQLVEVTSQLVRVG